MYIICCHYLLKENMCSWQYFLIFCCATYDLYGPVTKKQVIPKYKRDLSRGLSRNGLSDPPIDMDTCLLIATTTTFASMFTENGVLPPLLVMVGIRVLGLEHV